MACNMNEKSSDRLGQKTVYHGVYIEHEISFEHEICRRPTDHREVIPRISRMRLIDIRVIGKRHRRYSSVVIRLIRLIRVR